MTPNIVPMTPIKEPAIKKIRIIENLENPIVLSIAIS